MKTLSFLLPTLACAATALNLIGCSNLHSQNSQPKSIALINPRSIDKKAANYQNPFPVNTYEHFVASKEYPSTIKEYSNAALLSQAAKKKKFVVICLPEQRGRLYVDGKVALDWPISTGVPGHETPRGAFKVLSKELDHHSSRYGVFRNAEGLIVSSNADILSDKVPDGCSFHPSPMPYWQRLTGDGVGIHIGKVKPGRRLSHGCIRSPRTSAVKLYNATNIGTPVYITGSVEDFRTGAVDPADLKRVYKPAPIKVKKKTPAPQSSTPSQSQTTAPAASSSPTPSPSAESPAPEPSPAPTQTEV